MEYAFGGGQLYVGIQVDDSLEHPNTRSQISRGPRELLAFIHYADETAEARVFAFGEGVEFAQHGYSVHE